jgi:hypothetical protein
VQPIDRRDASYAVLALLALLAIVIVAAVLVIAAGRPPPLATLALAVTVPSVMLIALLVARHRRRTAP